MSVPDFVEQPKFLGEAAFDLRQREDEARRGGALRGLDRGGPCDGS